MMLTMHGLPPKTKYNEIKTLIKEKCNITDFILGTLGVDEDRTKNIRIGVASDREGDVIMKYLDGYRYSGHVLRIVPIGKPANETPQVNQWCNQQPESNYANPMNPGQQGVWPVQTNQQWSNTQPIQQQVPVQNNYEYVQPMVGQQNYYHQDRFPHNRGPQDGFSHNIPSNLIEPPRGNQPRPHAPINIVVTDQQQNRQPIQEGRYPNQGYNPEKPQAISKQGFQGPSHMGPQPTQPGPAYIQGHQWPSQGPQDTSRFQKQNPPQFEKSSNKIIEPEKRQILPHNQERNIEHQYEKGGRRFSPPRDHKDSNHGRRVSPPGHRISPNGHRILPSGRRISPPPRSSQFKDGISPTGRRFSPQRQIHPSGRQMSPTGRQNLQPGGHLGRRISPPGRRFSPPAPQISPTGRQNSQSGRQNFQPGRRISPPGRRFSPHGRQVSPSGRRNSPPPRQIAPTGRPISPSGRRMSPSGRRFSPSGRRTSPSGRRTSPPGRQFSPIGRRSSPRGQRTSPSGRRISPMGRKLSPSGRRNSPERSFLPPGRRVSPGRGMSPSSRRISPTGRRMSPGRTSPERRVSPGHRITPMNKGPQGDRHMPQRMSPGKPTMGRKMSPGRNISPNCGPPPRSFDRYSPSRNPMDNIRGGPKEVRPAYAAMTQAQKQPMYSGGYPPDSRETEQYPPGPRKGDQRPEWQERQKPYQPPAKPVEDRRDIPGVQKYDSRRGGDYSRPVINQPENKVSSPGRMSRSPNRRDRSPTRDRYRRHSPSPRSPRRSWALEKRRSPNIIEPPPPPSWPERQENVYKSSRQHDEENIKKSVWDRPEAQKKQEVNSTFFRKEERHNYDQEEKKYFGSTSRTQWDSRDQPKQDDELRDRSPLRSRPSDRYSPTQTISKLPREDYDMTDRNEFEQQSPRYQEPRGELYQKREKIKDDYDEFRHKRDNYRQNFDDREEELYMGQENLDREIEDVYNRAAELTRKTEEYQRNRSSKTRFNPDYERRVEDDVFGIKDGPSKQDFYEASHSKFDKTPRHMGETVIVDLAPAVQYKRDKAVDDLTGKVLKKFVPNVKGKVRDDIEEQLKILIEDMIFEMFGDKDVSFIEIVIKFEEKHGTKGMEKIFDKVISKFPIEIRLMKRPAPDVSTSPIEIARSASTGSMKDIELPDDSNISDWNMSSMVTSQEFDQASVMAPVLSMVPMMVPVVMAPMEQTPNNQEDPPQEGYCLYLCKDNFEAINEEQGQFLKEYIVKSIIEASERCSDGWTPDLILRGVQKETRYVVFTRDELSKNWLLKLDFSKFAYFNVIVYTSSDLENERAAIWLPGFPKSRSILPLKKLIMQNKHLENVNIHTWKLVREIIIEKGTRLYVDMPPSAALALEKYNMTLSYELQKVQVFLRTVAIDKDAFDAGLEEISAIGSSNLYQKNAPMPAIDPDAPDILKLCLDNTPVSLSTARKIKEELILQIYKHIKDGGNSKTDFLKYGYCQPGYFCVIPENAETANWVKSLRMRKFNNHTITVCETEKISVKHITMTCLLPYEQSLTAKKVIEKFKMCNRGVKGLKFNLWKNGLLYATKNNTKMSYRADVDLESVESLIKLNFILDYSKDYIKSETVYMKCHYKVKKLKDMIKTFKEETTDTLRVINMDISSDEDDVICLD
ncbi:PREDICTED: uncharacterized protein LOC106125742 isoform X5 [Papilio xuthus]|uniref:Uncharacterized protein LOC106125742 isoform X5 n=1 Tax=Papilio xuthus TaxID=66420 RepID=A0AAJ6ZSP4_PAPXU|nr:PREDICTED: uncharacterized protein LOC106125742 isoform X5 [Papilio xuthus]